MIFYCYECGFLPPVLRRVHIYVNAKSHYNRGGCYCRRRSHPFPPLLPWNTQQVFPIRMRTFNICLRKFIWYISRVHQEAYRFFGGLGVLRLLILFSAVREGSPFPTRTTKSEVKKNKEKNALKKLFPLGKSYTHTSIILIYRKSDEAG